MIPKIIHYCWFGRNPLPELAVKCIDSWKKFLPDYEIKEWNEDNFDVNIIPYTKEAYEAKKYAFVSDYARFYILYHHGGLYFDTDVEVIRPMDDIIAHGPFMGCENEAGQDAGATTLAVAPGLGLGCNPGLGLYAEILDLYAKLHFRHTDGRLNLKTVVQYTTELLVRHGLKNINDVQLCADVWVYPKVYFCPIDYYTGLCKMYPNTHTIHHYAASWVSPSKKLKNKIIGLIGKRMTGWLLKMKNLLDKK
ncbi:MULTISPECIES: glycosyltransferase family 32 protein [Bacteria]|jgi:mannosyltransferase OCH1-like enzyme|uniref:Glycosyl transferase n=2 Tax=Bacteroides TaxID=816 RepID=A0A4S2AFN0_9BACE|nr:glycosyltransferase [Bacteroides muris (ex Afrizal et al. 2022)]TGX99291.1 glycosyl transferase [Bacteroides muris (ex Afrizal et al. 2022)]